MLKFYEYQDNVNMKSVTLIKNNRNWLNYKPAGKDKKRIELISCVRIDIIKEHYSVKIYFGDKNHAWFTYGTKNGLKKFFNWFSERSNCAIEFAHANNQNDADLALFFAKYHAILRYYSKREYKNTTIHGWNHTWKVFADEHSFTNHMSKKEAIELLEVMK